MNLTPSAEELAYLVRLFQQTDAMIEDAKRYAQQQRREAALCDKRMGVLRHSWSNEEH